MKSIYYSKDDISPLRNKYLKLDIRIGITNTINILSDCQKDPCTLELKVTYLGCTHQYTY